MAPFPPRGRYGSRDVTDSGSNHGTRCSLSIEESPGSIVVVTLLTDDVFHRLKPICDFLSRRYNYVTILLFDRYGGRFNFNRIIDGFKGRNYNTLSFTTVREGLNIIKRFKRSDFIYLVRHCQVDYRQLGLFLLYVLGKNAHNKVVSRCNILVIRKVLSDEKSKRKEGMISFYTVLKNKYYFDEFYGVVFVKGTQRLANWLYRFDNQWVIDPFVNAVGKFGRWLSEISDWFDTHVVDAIVNGVAAITGWFGGVVGDP